ncbi:MAG TPA: phosphotransferase [Propionibacteriaceae bacterium]|nr:phosphotransferase [Propionibacteriaceae bacterium]
MSGLAPQLANSYRLHDVRLRQLATLVNDVVAVTAAEGDFALKLYHRNRTPEAVEWEVNLLIHLHRREAPVVQPIAGRDGHLNRFEVAGQQRIAVLFAWAPGSKPVPSWKTYLLLGEAAGRIHWAAEGFAPSATRENYDAADLIDDQLRRMRNLLEQADRWRSVVALGERLKERLARTALDRGICHMDLTLDNVHLGEKLTVFDFDSAGLCWRAIEPWGVLRFSAAYFEAWVAGYRTVRPFSTADEESVAAFAIIGDLGVVAWKLGVAESSRGISRLGPADLPTVVDGWLDWEAARLGR